MNSPKSVSHGLQGVRPHGVKGRVSPGDTDSFALRIKAQFQIALILPRAGFFFFLFFPFLHEACGPNRKPSAVTGVSAPVSPERLRPRLPEPRLLLGAGPWSPDSLKSPSLAAEGRFSDVYSAVFLHPALARTLCSSHVFIESNLVTRFQGLEGRSHPSFSPLKGPNTVPMRPSGPVRAGGLANCHSEHPGGRQ